MIRTMQPVRPWRNAAGLYDVTDKLDGWRLLARRGEAYTRGGGDNLYAALPATIRDRLGSDWLDGELVAAGQPATAVATALACGGDGLTFWPFALPDAALGADAERARLRDMGWEPPAYFGRYSAAQIGQRWPAWSATVNEGIVLRGPSGWYKLKRSATVDLPVVDVTAGAGRLAGMIGALVCRLPSGVLVRVGTGLNDAERAGAAEQLIGRMVEVGYQARTVRSLQHPRFIRWRDDLPRQQVQPVRAHRPRARLVCRQTMSFAVGV